MRKNILALDCGNSSYRAVLGYLDSNSIKTELISRKHNQQLWVNGYYYWDILQIFQFFLDCLKDINHRGIRIDSIGVCAWGVDFALFDSSGIMLGNPLSYRNSIGLEQLDRLEDYEQKELFEQTGILCDKINSLYMLAGIRNKFPDLFNIADKVLMIPDILNYLLTGKMINEPTGLSTTQALDVRNKYISNKVCMKFDLSADLFCEIGEHGNLIGFLNESLKKECQLDYDIPVICVPSHDTAAAVLAVPSSEDSFAFISSGTWSLIGAELDEPVISDLAFENSLTNELGAFNRITLLKNSNGMFIFQKLLKEYQQQTGEKTSWTELNELGCPGPTQNNFFNVNDNRFFNPENMAFTIYDFLKETKQVKGEFKWSEIIRASHLSVALACVCAVLNVEQVTGKSFDKVYIVGGGSLNTPVNNIIARATGKKVIACSKESTSLGNIAAQIKYHNPSVSLPGIRQIIRNSINTVEYASYEPPRKDLLNGFKNIGFPDV